MRTFTQMEAEFEPLWEKYVAENPADFALKDVALKWYKFGCIKGRQLDNGRIIGATIAGYFVETSD